MGGLIANNPDISHLSGHVRVEKLRKIRTFRICPGAEGKSSKAAFRKGYSPDTDKMSGHVRHVRVGPVYPPPLGGIYGPHGGAMSGLMDAKP